MGRTYTQTCPSCAAGPVVASRDEDRHRRRASELYAASRQSFDEAREERHCAAGEGQHRHFDCDHRSHIAEAEEAERAGRELNAEGDREVALADAAQDAMFAYVGKACRLCGGTGRISGNGSAQVGGSGKSSNNNVGR